MYCQVLIAYCRQTDSKRILKVTDAMPQLAELSPSPPPPLPLKNIRDIWGPDLIRLLPFSRMLGAQYWFLNTLLIPPTCLPSFSLGGWELA